MTMKVGIEGRIITGPAGGPGNVDVPMRIAVVQEGITSEGGRRRNSARETVTINGAVDRVNFTHIDPDISFPLPAPITDISSYVVYVGFDPQARSRKRRSRPRARGSRVRPKPRSSCACELIISVMAGHAGHLDQESHGRAAKRGCRVQASRMTNDELVRAYHPRRSMMVPLSARMSEMTTRAPAARKLIGEPRPRRDCRRQSRPPSCRRRRRPRRRRPNPPPRCSRAARHAHLGGGVQEQVGRRLAVRHFGRREQVRLEEADQVRCIPG